MIWFFVWFVFSAIILGAFAWSMRILLLQKRTWKVFANKNGLTYSNGGRFAAAPSLAGSFAGVEVNLFTDRKVANDARGERFVTVIELQVPTPMPMRGCIYTEEMKALVAPLEWETISVPEHISGWDRTWGVASNDPAAMTVYMNDSRYDVLKKIFGMKIIAALLVFNYEEAVIRIETIDPLNNAVKLEKIIRSLSQMFERLVASESEIAAMSAVATTAPAPVAAAETVVADDVVHAADENTTAPSVDS